MKNKGNLDNILYNSRRFTSNEQKLCTSNRELIGIGHSLTECEHVINGSDLFISALNDH